VKRWTCKEHAIEISLDAPRSTHRFAVQFNSMALMAPATNRQIPPPRAVDSGNFARVV